MFLILIAYLGLLRTTEYSVHYREGGGGGGSESSIQSWQDRKEIWRLYISQNLITTNNVYITNITKTRNLPRAISKSTGFVQNFQDYFPWVFPEFLMISTHFSLSFLIKIDVFFPESVVCKLYDILCYFYFILFYFLSSKTYTCCSP